MNENWQVGDLALCIEDGCSKIKKWLPRKGAIYTVSEVGSFDDYIWLDLHEDMDINEHFAWDARIFRKITPPEADEFDREVIAAMTGKPEQVPA